MSIWKWDQLLELPAADARITLGEGRTPVVPSRRIGPAIGLKRLQFKLENVNPSGSYKDRFAAAAISFMQAAGKKRCVATSSGNTGAALAAYCAASGIECSIAIVETTPVGKLVQMQAHGAKLFRVRGFGLDPEITRRALALIQERGKQADAALQISAYCYSPEGMSGVQTISYELAEEVGDIEHVFVPAGGGGLALAVARGFQDLLWQGISQRVPRIHCVQPEGNATIAKPLRDGSSTAVSVDCTTLVSGLQVPIVLDGDEVITSCRNSGGQGFLVQDAEVWEAQRKLLVEEGIFCEPAGAVALAGALQAAERGEIGRDDSVVCLVTGTGFKDLASVERLSRASDCAMVDVAQLANLL